MTRRTPELGSLIGARAPGPERDRFARVHDVLVRAGPAPALPAALAHPPAVAVRGFRVGRHAR